MKATKKLIGLLLALAMVVTMVSAFGLTVAALGEVEDVQYTEMTAWTFKQMADGDGVIKLQNDICIKDTAGNSKVIYLYAGSDITIDLNGHLLTGAEANSPVLFNYGTVTLKDSSTDVYNFYQVQADGLWKPIKNTYSGEYTDIGSQFGIPATGDVIRVKGGAIVGSGVTNQGTSTGYSSANCNGGAGEMIIDGANFIGNNHSTGAVQNLGGKLTVWAGYFLGNTADRGPAIQNKNGTMVLGDPNYHAASVFIKFNKAASSGGAILNYSIKETAYKYTSTQAEATINFLYIDYNTAGKYGGGIYNLVVPTAGENQKATLTMNEGNLRDNIAAERGGAIANYTSGDVASAVVNLNGTQGHSPQIVWNTAQNTDPACGYGGGIYNAGTLTLNYSNIYGNIASYGGGGIYNTATLLVNKGAVISDNKLRAPVSSETYGGGILSSCVDKSATVYLNGGVIENNDAGSYYVNNTPSTEGRGAGICVRDDNESVSVTAKLYINDNDEDNVIIRNNTASNGGGGIMLRYGAYLDMPAGTITGNTAGKNGGGIDIGDGCNAYVYGGSITGNSSGKYGGGIAVRDNGTLTLFDASITGNTAKLCGGGISYCEGDTAEHGVTVKGSAVVKDNTSGETGSEKTDNLYLGANKLITLDDATQNSSVGVTLAGGAGRFTYNIPVSLGNFHSDNPDYAVKYIASSGTQGQPDYVREHLALVSAFDDRFGGTVTAADYTTIYTENAVPTADCHAKTAGYTFAGWYDGIDGTGNKLTGSPVADTVYYAKWTKDGKTVLTQTLDLCYGTPLANSGITWDGSSHTLTLDGANIDLYGDAERAITFPQTTCTIVVTEGTVNNVTLHSTKQNAEDSYAIAIDALSALHINGKGTLNVAATAVSSRCAAIVSEKNQIYSEATVNATAADLALCVQGQGSTFKILSGNITATAAAGVTEDISQKAISTNDGPILIQGGTVTATGGSHAICAGTTKTTNGKLNISGGTVNATAAAAGLWSYGDVSITGGTVNATATGTPAGDYGIYSRTGNVSISGQDTYVTATSTSATDGSQYGVNAKAGNVTVTEPAVLIASGSTKAVNIGDQKTFTALGAKVDANKLTDGNGTGTDILTPAVDSVTGVITGIDEAKYVKVRFSTVCPHGSTADIAAGLLRLKLGETGDAGKYTFTQSGNGWLINVADDQYVCFDAATKTAVLGTTPTVWSYDGGLYVENTTSVRCRVFFWWYYTKNTTTKYYLDCSADGLTVSTAKVQAAAWVEGEHTLGYTVHTDDHDVICTACGEVFNAAVPHSYTGGNDGHECVCGDYDPKYIGINTVEVKCDTSAKSIGFWFWKKTVNHYKYTFTATGNRVTASKIKWSADGSTWKTTNGFTTTTSYSTLYFDITDSDGTVTHWQWNAPDQYARQLSPN